MTNFRNLIHLYCQVSKALLVLEVSPGIFAMHAKDEKKAINVWNGTNLRKEKLFPSTDLAMNNKKLK